MKKNFGRLKKASSIIPPKFKNKKWFVEWPSENELHCYEVEKIIACKKTPYQKILLAEFKNYGKVLVIDDEIQSVEKDEYIYHELLIHPAMIMHPKPETVLIIGAGEGATAREILKYKTVKKIVTVDIDNAVVNFAKKYMYSWHKNSFKNKKLSIVIEDAKKYIERTRLKFDVVISDLPCPLPNGPAFELYTVEFYKKLNKIMTKNAVFAAQAGPMTPHQLDFHKVLHKTLGKVFKTTQSYYGYIPSFHSQWSFIFSSRTKKQNPLLKRTDFFDRVICNAVKGDLKYIDGITMEGMFRIPKTYRETLSKNKQISKEKKPKTFRFFSTH